MGAPREELFQLKNNPDLLAIRKRIKDLSAEINLSVLEQTKFATAVSELSRNVLRHGGGGEARIELLDDKGVPALRVIFEDRGAGIAEIDLAMTDGFTTAKGLGLGLGGAKRLVDHFEIKSAANEGTVVTILKRGRR